MTTAAYLGIDSCPIEVFNRSKAEKYLIKNCHLDIAEWGISYMVGFGYNKQNIPDKKRQKLEEIYQIID